MTRAGDELYNVMFGGSKDHAKKSHGSLAFPYAVANKESTSLPFGQRRLQVNVDTRDIASSRRMHRGHAEPSATGCHSRSHSSLDRHNPSITVDEVAAHIVDFLNEEK